MQWLISVSRRLSQLTSGEPQVTYSGNILGCLCAHGSEDSVTLCDVASYG